MRLSSVFFATNNRNKEVIFSFYLSMELVW